MPPLVHPSNAADILKVFSRSQTIVTFALDGTNLNANDNFLDLMGYELLEVRGRHRLFLTLAYAESPAYAAFQETLLVGQFTAAMYQKQNLIDPGCDVRGRSVLFARNECAFTNPYSSRAIIIDFVQKYIIYYFQLIILSRETMAGTA